MASINLTTGKVQHAVPLVAAPGIRGRSIKLSLGYDSNVRDNVTTWNADAPTGLAGLGWTFTWPMIVRQTRLSGDINDDLINLVTGGSAEVLVPLGKQADGTAGFQTRSARFFRISYDAAADRWTIVKNDGTTLVFGGDAQHIEWGVSWGNAWIGESLQTQKQTQYARVWHIAVAQNIYGERMRYTYAQDVDDTRLIGSGGKAFTRAMRLARIDADDSYSVVLSYQPKDANECIPDRTYVAGGSGTPGVTPYQDPSETHYLARADVLNPAGKVIRSTLLDYYTPHLNAENPQMTKRLLKSVTRISSTGLLLRPPVLFDYYGRSGQQADGFKFDVSPATAMVFSNGGLYGALSTVTTPSGAVKAIAYTENKIGSRDFVVPTRQGAIDPILYHGDDYIVISWKVGSDQFALDVYQWVHGQWTSVYALAPTKSPFGDRANVQISAQPSYFAVFCLNCPGVPLIHYKDPFVDGKWNTFGEQFSNTDPTRLYQTAAASDIYAVFVMTTPQSSVYAAGEAELNLYNGKRAQFGGGWSYQHEFVEAGTNPEPTYSWGFTVCEHNVFVVSASAKPDQTRPSLAHRRIASFDQSWQAVDVQLDGPGNWGFFFPAPGSNDYGLVNLTAMAGNNFVGVSARGTFFVDPTNPQQNNEYKYFAFDWLDGAAPAPIRAQLLLGPVDMGQGGVPTYMATAPDAIVVNDGLIGAKAKHVFRFDGAQWFDATFNNDAASFDTLSLPVGLGVTVEILERGLASEHYRFYQYVPAASGAAAAGWALQPAVDLPTHLDASSVEGIITAFASLLVVVPGDAALEGIGIAASQTVMQFGPMLLAQLMEQRNNVNDFGLRYLATSKNLEGDCRLYYRNPYVNPVTQAGNEWAAVNAMGIDLEKLIGARCHGSQFAFSNNHAVFSSFVIAEQKRTTAVCLLKNGCIQISDRSNPAPVMIADRLGNSTNPSLVLSGLNQFALLVDPNNSSLMLCRVAQDGCTGAMSDYCGASITVMDGYQTLRSFNQYDLTPALVGYSERAGSAAYGLARTAAGGTDYASSAALAGYSEQYAYTGKPNAPNAPPSNLDTVARFAAGRTYLANSYDAAGNKKAASTTTSTAFFNNRFAPTSFTQSWMRPVRVDSTVDGVVSTASYEYETVVSGNLRSSTKTGGPVPGLDAEPEAVTTTSTFGWEKYPELLQKNILGPTVQSVTTRKNVRSAVDAGTLAWSAPLPNMAPLAGANFALYACPSNLGDCLGQGFPERAYVLSTKPQGSAAQIALCNIGRSGSIEVAKTFDTFGTKTLSAVDKPCVTIDANSASAYITTATGYVCAVIQTPGPILAASAQVSKQPLFREAAVNAFGQAVPGVVYVGDTTGVYGLQASPAGGLSVKYALSVTGEYPDLVAAAAPLCSGYGDSVYVAAQSATGTRVGALCKGSPIGPQWQWRLDLGAAILQRPAIFSSGNAANAVDTVFAFVQAANGSSSLVAVTSTHGDKLGTIAASCLIDFTPASAPIPVAQGEYVYAIGTDNRVRLFRFDQNAKSMTAAWNQPYSAPGAITLPVASGNDQLLLNVSEGTASIAVTLAIAAPRAVQTYLAQGLSFLTGPQYDPINDRTLVLGTGANNALTLAAIDDSGIGIAQSAGATTWNVAELRPDASYTWLGTGVPDFFSPNKKDSDWLCEGRTTLAFRGTPLETQNAEGLTGSVIYDKTVQFAIASFANASVSAREAFFTAFESYEDLSMWTPALGAAINADDSYTGQGSLVVAGGAKFALTPAARPLSRSPGNMVLGAWVKTATGYSNGKLTLALTLDGATVGSPLAVAAAPGAWTYVQTIVPFSGLGCVGKRMGLAIANADKTPVRIDNVRFSPVVGGFSATIVEPVFRLPIAAIDDNGNVTRTAYDPRQRVLGATRANGTAVGCSMAVLSRETSATGLFDPAQPNRALSVAARSGGTYFRFRTPADTEGWQLTGPGAAIVSGAIVLQKANDSARFKLDADVSSAAVRAWVDSTQDVSLQLLGVQMSYVPSKGQFVVSIAGGPTTTVTAPFDPDWLLAIIADPPAKKMSVTAYAGGRALFDQAVALPANTPNAIELDSSGLATFGPLFLLIDPVTAIGYTDGTGHARQSQGRESVSSILVGESLYDALGRGAFSTKVVRKGAGAQKVDGFAFEPRFVAGRDPASGDPLWTTGVMSGYVGTWWTDPDWTNPNVRAEDRNFPYSGTYYEASPLSRVVKTTGPAKEYGVNGTHAVTQTYGLANVPQAAGLMKQMGVLAKDFATYTASATTAALSDTDRIVDVSVADAFGRSTVGSTWHSDAKDDQLIDGSRYAFGADGGAESDDLQPNSFATGNDAFKVESRSNARDLPVEGKRPDEGETDAVFDRSGRVRYARDGAGAAQGYFRYRSYDTIGRVIERGTVSRTLWDAGLLGTAAQAAPDGATQGLRGRWPLAQGSAFANDTSGNGNNGTASGTFTWNADAPNGIGVTPQFSSGAGTRIAFGAQPIVPAGSKTLSVSAWIKLPAGPVPQGQNTYAVAARGNISGNPTLYLGTLNDATTQMPSLFFGIYFGANRWSGTYVQIKQQDLNTWLHLSATDDGQNVRLYRNGKLAGTGSSVLASAGTLGDWTIGAFGASSTGAWNGSIDDVRIHDRALSDGDVAAAFVQGLGVPLRQNVYDVPASGAVAQTLGELVEARAWDATPPAAGQVPAPAAIERFVYDVNGAIVEHRITVGDYDTTERVTTYTYNDAGVLQRLTYPQPAGLKANGVAPFAVTYGYDSMGRLQTVGSDAAPDAYARYGYNAGGSVIAETLGEGKLARSMKYDTLGRLLTLADPSFTQSLSYRQGGDPTKGYMHGGIQSESMQYNSALFPPDGPKSYTYTYSFDPFGRLVKADCTLPEANFAASYSADGDIQTLTRGTQTANYTYKPGTHQVVAVEGGTLPRQCTYDGSGSLLTDTGRGITGIRWDPLSRLAGTMQLANGTLEYRYDSGGTRVLKRFTQSGGGFDQLILNGTGSRALIEEKRPAGGGPLERTLYVYGVTGLIAVCLDDDEAVPRKGGKKGKASAAG